MPRNDAFRTGDLFYNENTVQVCTYAYSLVLGLGGLFFVFKCH